MLKQALQGIILRPFILAADTAAAIAPAKYSSALNKTQTEIILNSYSFNREKRFILVGDSLLFSDAFRELHVGAKYLYFCMAMESAGKRDFQFPTAAARKYGITPTSFWSYVHELENKHFIVCRSNKHLRQPNDYSFSDGWKTIRTVPFSVPLAMAKYNISDRNPDNGKESTDSLVDRNLVNAQEKDGIS